MSGAELRAPATRRPPELAWLAEVLWGPNPAVEVLVGKQAMAGPPAQRWGVLPSLHRPRVLVPLSSGGPRPPPSASTATA